MSLIAIGVTVGGATPSSAQIPITASGISTQLTTLTQAVSALGAQNTTLQAAVSTCVTDEGAATAQANTANTNMATLLAYISSVLGSPDKYLNRTAETATIGGSLTVGDILKVIFTSSHLSGSPITISYTTIAGDTIDTMATGLAAAINVNSTLAAANVTASAASNIVTIDYGDAEVISLSSSVTGSTETITLASVTSTTPAATVTQIQAYANATSTAIQSTITALATVLAALNQVSADASALSTGMSTVTADATNVGGTVKGADVFIQTDNSVVSGASQLSGAFTNALQFAVANGIVNT